jgi:hypothetical protein
MMVYLSLWPLPIGGKCHKYDISRREKFKSKTKVAQAWLNQMLLVIWMQ